ncbi:MAG: hypothetical protein Q8P11_00430 [bacterium]|nr:hypothetical protein [bacterium]
MNCCKQIEQQIKKKESTLKILEKKATDALATLTQVMVQGDWGQVFIYEKYMKRLLRKVVKIIKSLFNTLVYTPGPESLPKRILNKSDQVIDYAVNIEKFLKSNLMLVCYPSML